MIVVGVVSIVALKAAVGVCFSSSLIHSCSSWGSTDHCKKCD